MVLTVGVTALFLGFLLPLGRASVGYWAGNAVCGVLTVLVVSPFLRALVMKKNHSEEVVYILNYLSPFSGWVHLCVAIVVMSLIVGSRRIKWVSIRMERTFFINLRSREIMAERQRPAMPGYARRLQSKNLHLTQVELPEGSAWAGHTLSELALGRDTGVMITSILRDDGRHNIPDGSTRLYPADRLEIIGDDESIKQFMSRMEHDVTAVSPDTHSPMVLRTLMVSTSSPLAGLTVAQSHLREHYRCMVVGMSAGRDLLEIASADSVIRPGCKLWVVGEAAQVAALCAETPG